MHIKIHLLKVAPKSWGRKSDGDLVESIRTKGLLSPIIVSKDNNVLSGHRRVDACKKLGVKEIRAVVSDQTDVP